jgi:hypothetical protein
VGSQEKKHKKEKKKHKKKKAEESEDEEEEDDDEDGPDKSKEKENEKPGQCACYYGYNMPWCRIHDHYSPRLRVVDMPAWCLEASRLSASILWLVRPADTPPSGVALSMPAAPAKDADSGSESDKSPARRDSRSPPGDGIRGRGKPRSVRHQGRGRGGGKGTSDARAARPWFRAAPLRWCPRLEPEGRVSCRFYRPWWRVCGVACLCGA